MATFWVNNVTGDDVTGDGSESNPWKSISHAVNQAQAQPIKIGHVIKVVKTDTIYTDYVPIGAAFIGNGFGDADYPGTPGITIEGYPNTDWPTCTIIGIIGGRPFFDIQPQANFILLRNFKFESGGVIPPNEAIRLDWRSVMVRVECCEWTYSYRSLVGIRVLGTGSRDIYLEIRCCYWHPGPPVGGGWARFFEWTDAPDANLLIHHCVLAGQYVLPQDVGIYLAGPNNHGTVRIYNNLFWYVARCIEINGFASVGDVRAYSNLYIHVANYVYYCPNAIAATTLEVGHNNNWDVNQLCNDPACNLCQIAGAGPGSMTVDPDFLGGGPWEWLYGLFLSQNFTPQNRAVLIGADDGNAIGPIDPANEPPCFCAIPLPAPPCARFEVTDCNYGTFSGAYPEDWEVALGRPKVSSLVKVVCYDPGGANLQVTCFVKSMRPLKQTRDIDLGTYKRGDVDVELIDPDGQFDWHRADSLLPAETWFGKHVDIGLWLVGTQLVLKLARMFLADTEHDAGITRWRLQDIFGWMLDQAVRANSIGNTEEDSAGGGTMDQSLVTVDSSVCKQESWTITFTDATHYGLSGSKTGADGSGATTADFTSDSGAITIPSAAWAGVFAGGDTVTFKSGVRYTSTNVITAARNMLVTLAGVPASWLDSASWGELEAQSIAYKVTIWIYQDKDALSTLRAFMLHRLATAYANHDGKIALMLFEPGPDSMATRCLGKRWSLMKCRVRHLPILNSISVESGYRDGTTPQTGATYPDPGSVNTSIAKYGYEFPFKFIVRGYTGGEAAVMRDLCQRIYNIRAGVPHTPRQIYEMDLKANESNLLIGEIIYIDSAHPKRTRYAMIYELSKDPDGRKVQAKALDVSDFIEIPGGCGYAYCGGTGYTDDCWVYGY